MDGSDDADSEPDEEEAEIMKKFMHVNDKSFEEMEMPPKVVTATQKAWNGFVSVFDKREAAADAIYGAFFDAAPNLQGMFRAPRAAAGSPLVDFFCFRPLFDVPASCRDGTDKYLPGNGLAHSQWHRDLHNQCG